MAMQQANVGQEEVCSNCGDFTDTLLEETGWCRSCSNRNPVSSATGLCQRCGNSSEEKYCRRCRFIKWLERNADDVDRFIALGLTTEQAIRASSNRNGATGQCIICGDPVRALAVFCNRRPQCRSAKRRMKYLVYEKYISRNDALLLVKEKFGSEYDRGASS